MAKFDWYTIRASKYGGFDVHGFDTYPDHSVLAGQTRKCFLDRFDTLEEAQQAFPQAEMGSAWTDPQVSLSHLPGEDDPVAGGMYPDDYDDDNIHDYNAREAA